MNRMSAEHLVLDLAVDDYTGLWEIVWGIEASRPNADMLAAGELAKRAVHALLEKGYIEIYEGRKFNGDEHRIPRSDRRAVLATEAYWNPPLAADFVHVRVSATEAGEHAYEMGTA